MNYTKRLQEYIEENGSKIKLKDTVNDKFANYQPRVGRGFTLMDAEIDEKTFLLLNESSLNTAKGIFESIEGVDELIYEWLEYKIDLADLPDKYENVELYDPILETDSDYEEEWNILKNLIFSDYGLQKFDQ